MWVEETKPAWQEDGDDMGVDSCSHARRSLPQRVRAMGAHLGIMMIMKGGIVLSSVSLSATLFTFSWRDATYSQDFTGALLSNSISRHTEACQVHWVTGVLPVSPYSVLTKYALEGPSAFPTHE